MKTKNYTIYLILFYIWILILGPHQRFQILETIHLERIVILLCWASLFIGGKMTIRFSWVSLLVIFFFLWLLGSYYISPYSHTPLAQDWIENYWKFIVLYFLILYAINDLNDFYILSVGIVLILFTYQAYSWLDFLRGGNYVYQQGIRRIVGIWTSGLGAPNYFGMMSMLSLPFAYFWYQLTENKNSKILILCHYFLSFLSIVFSGTRGALLGVVVFIILNMRSFKKVFSITLILIFLISATYVMLPDHLRYRYFGMITSEKNTGQIDEDADEIQKMSAESRIEGLVDGWNLALLKPLTGFGPGSSARARNKVNPDLKFIYDDYLQLHNLYGQVLAESGFIGTAIFISIFIVFFFQLIKLKDDFEEFPFLKQFIILVQNFTLLMLFYGMISHTLYRYYWFIVFAQQGALISLVKFDKDELKRFAKDMNLLKEK